jgi:SNF2 family DNA or RNA helicase
VYDAIDVAHLQAAQKGYDSLYKMAVLDVSQNVDRFKTALGILPCITPGGCDFATNRQEALSGKQLLLLQGMPMNKLLFGTETQKECQDLAGNAMTTTVIGASIVSALICGSQAFRSNPSATPSQASKTQRVLLDIDFIRLKSMKVTRLALNEIKQLDLASMKQDAMLSARLCNCEGDKSLCKFAIHVCSSCEHTACERCLGNPRHDYGETIPRNDRKQTPNDFVQKWKHELPTRLRFGVFPDIRRLVSMSKSLDKATTAFVDHVVETRLESQHYYFRNMLRQDYGWTIIYSSANATLELRIGHELEWLLFINCPPELPGNDPLRKLLSNPIAHAKVTDSLIDVEWSVRAPTVQKHKLQINGSVSRCSSWRSRLGLLDYKNETVPASLHVEAIECNTLVGEFVLLPDCGTASNSLYKRLTAPPLYLFLDPSPLGAFEDDAFVFSQDCRRKHYNDTRICLAHVEASWRPWHVQDQCVHDLGVTLPGTWTPVTMGLELVDTVLTTSVPTSAMPSENFEHDCSRAVTILEARVPEQLPVASLDEYSWVLERPKRLPSFSTWQPVSTSTVKGCACAPKYPHILWHVNEKGIATPQESRKAAADFERTIKTRAPIFHIRATAGKTETNIQVALNIAALVHRAKGRLTGTVHTAWKLAIDHADLPPEPFTEFRLRSNSEDSPFALTPSISYLRNAQPRSLSWMKAQELGRSITITEVEEAVHVDLGWRAEARAQTDVSIRGGVLADLPSFGKTVTCIALIQNEFDQDGPEVLLRNIQDASKGTTEALIRSAATLVVCPPHIALQWQTELLKFLGEEYEMYNVLVLQSFAQLQELSISDVQDSRVVVISWSVFAEEEYISHMAHFSAIPEPSITGRRAFDTWFSQASSEIPRQVAALQSSSYTDFKNSTQDLLAKRLEHEDFKVALPIKVQHGSAYQSFNTTQSTKAKRTSIQNKRKVPSGSTSHQVPLLHLFNFNRVVVDEYHYLNDDKKLGNVLASVSVKRITALKRWVLSGTPALANFTDVDQIASYLGIRLGRYHFGDGVETTQSDRARRGDQTLVEDFLSQTEIMSRQWHKARHERAQEFLDLFVRQNEACLGHIACAEMITPIKLDIGHHAVYLELSQYLISQKMQIKKLKKNLRSDKIDRLNASLNNSMTAEDALLKSALLFKTSSGTSALEVLTELRSTQLRSVQMELRELMAGFEGLSKSDELCELYSRFKHDILEFNWLGDDHASRLARFQLNKAKLAPIRSAFPELKGTTEVMRARLAKKRLSNLRETARDLAHLVRSERFISAIQHLLGPLSNTKKGQTFLCSHPDCDETASLAQLRLITHCGHTACEKCLAMRTDTDTCVHPMCSLFVQGVNLVRVTDIGSTTEPAGEQWFGRKMETITHIISKFPKGDQGVVFAPNDETVEILEEVLEYQDISYHSLRGCKATTSAKIIEDFKTDDDPDHQSKVLLLNMGSESAAGA